MRFYREIERLMLEVCEHPQLFRQFDPPAQRHFTDRFPYGVIYLVEPDITSGLSRSCICTASLAIGASA
jgi:hypothetical protein